MPESPYAPPGLAGLRESESEQYRCGHCQHYTGAECRVVTGYVGPYDVCDLFSGHQRWN